MGAWGVEPFQNDSALDWLAGIEEKIEKTFKKALRPLRKKKHLRFVFPPKLRPAPNLTHKQALARRRLIASGVKKVVEHKLTMTTYCQNEALAAVVLVRSLPVLHMHGGFKDPGTGTLIEQAERVCDQLLKDEGFIGSWNRPAEYIAVVEAERRRVRAVVLKQRREEEAVVQGFVRKIKRMSKNERAAVVRGAKKGRYYRSGFAAAWERVTSKPLFEPPPEPKHRAGTVKRHRRYVRRLK